MAYCDRNHHFDDGGSASSIWDERDFCSNRAFRYHLRGHSAEVSASVDGAVRWFCSSRMGRVVGFWDIVHGYWNIFWTAAYSVGIFLEGIGVLVKRNRVLLGDLQVKVKELMLVIWSPVVIRFSTLLLQFSFEVAL